MGVSMASRVVPATSETTSRSSPRRRFTKEDFPTLGLPITATRRASGSSSSPASGRRATRASRMSPLPFPLSPLMGYGSPRPSSQNSWCPVEVGAPRLSTLLTTRSVGRCVRRRYSATS